MSKRQTIFIILVLIVAGACIAYWYIKTSGSEKKLTEEGSAKGPVAKVQVVPLNRSKIEQTIVVYGTVIAAIGQTQTFSVPFESQVRQVLVTTGQAVDVNTPLVEIEPSPDSQLRFEQARVERDTAKNNLELVKQRLDLRLATRQDLITAQQNFDAAQFNVKSMEQRGVDGNKTIPAMSKGLVSRIDVDQGQIVPAGTTLLETVGENQKQVRLGIDNEYIDFLKPGQAVGLYKVNAPEKKMFNGTIRMITQGVNPQTRMIDVFVIPERGAALLLNEYVEAHIVVRSDEGFLVPRAALLPEDGTYVIFTIENEHAHRHIVHIGLENSEKVQIYSDDLKEGQQVVVMGNYELQDDIAVEVERQ